METRRRPNRFVLIVEDEQRDAELITELLHECDCEIAVDVATNAEEGLAKVVSSRFDLIICDYCLPGMDGLSFLKVLKKSKGNIPVLVLTSYPQQELQAQFIRHGACTYLSKDADRQILVNVVLPQQGRRPSNPCKRRQRSACSFACLGHVKDRR